MEMSIAFLTTPPGAVPPTRVLVGAGVAPTSDERVEVPNAGADDLADLARMDSDAG
jgi:hypothetical protein